MYKFNNLKKPCYFRLDSRMEPSRSQIKIRKYLNKSSTSTIKISETQKDRYEIKPKIYFGYAG